MSIEKEVQLVNPDGTTGATTLTHSNSENTGFFAWLIFTVKGFIFPCFSPSFYQNASKRNPIGVIAFFFIFAFVTTFVPTFQIAKAMYGVGNEIEGAYERGEIPTIVIEEGIAEVDGPQPLIFEDNRNIFAIDTTGKVNEIDTESYSQGILLTRTEIHFVNEDGYQILQLSDINNEFGDSIVLDEDQILGLWNMVSIWIIILLFVFILIWNSFIRLAYISLMGLIIWGIVSLIKKDVSFKSILVTGLLANVPVIYLKFILSLVNFSFVTLYTMLLIVAWSLALIVVLKNKNVEGIENSVIE